MGGNNRQRKSSGSPFSLFSMFKRGSATKKVNEAYKNNYWDEPPRPRKVFPSDEDRGYWVAEPGIDRKASAFIAKFHEARRFEAQTMQAIPNN